MVGLPVGYVQPNKGMPVKGHETVRAFFFRQGNGAGIQVVVAVSERLPGRYMRMAVQEKIAGV